MASLSLPSDSATGMTQALPLRNRVQSPTSPSSSPLPKAGDTATIVAFRNARDTYRKSLSEKDFKRIMLPTVPEDVVHDIETWHKRHLHSKIATSVRSGLNQLQRFSASIDMLAQGTPSPGCLLWGSIKFVLTIVQDAVQAYEQLCKALVRMIDCLPRIEVYTETFLESSLVADCVNAFYVSAIRFWARACKFYSRRRLWRVLRAIWNDFDTEYGSLEADMIRNRDKVEGAALAEHIGQSKSAKVSQQCVNFKLLEARTSTRRKEITAWLAPVAYDVEYFSNELASAGALRHPKTCSWVLNKPELMQLCDTSYACEKSLLWIYANPGAGKTVLAAFLIDHFQFKGPDSDGGNVFYFFCKNTDTDKNTASAVVRSLLYQLYKSVEDQEPGQSMNNDIGLALDRSGQQRAVNFTVLWHLFSTYVINLSPATIIIDALDECQDPKELIGALQELSKLRYIKVVLTSRKESHLQSKLSGASSFEIAPDDIDADIAAFVQAKVEASSQLSHPLVRDVVVTKLCNAHDGMFLWVYLVLKELKSCISVAQVQDALEKLPIGLDGIYKGILQRLQTTLTRSSLDLCSKVLTWVVSAVRPLGVHEIRQALILHYEMDGDILLTDDRSFPYSDKDVELICGSLVTIRKGTLQVIHLTVKEFLRSSQNMNGFASSILLVDPEIGSLQLTLVCLKCIADYAEPLMNLKSKAPQIDWTLDPAALQRSQTRAPLLEYACFSWLVHIIDCKLDDLLKITPTFQKTFSSSVSFSWVETCMASQPDSTLRLLVGFDEIHDRFNDYSQAHHPQQDDSSLFLSSWCTAMSRIFEEYGAIFARRPWEIYLVDLSDIFEADPTLRKLWQEYGETTLRARNVHVSGYQACRPPQKMPQPHLQLQKSLQFRSSGSTSVFLVHNERLNVYIWGETVTEGDYYRIFVQHDKTGQRLPPAEDFSGESGQKWRLINHEASQNGSHLVLFYHRDPIMPEIYQEFHTLTIFWRINEKISFERRMDREPWARVVFSHISKVLPRIFGSSRTAMFEDDHHCMTPSGRLDLLTGSRWPLPHGVLNTIKRADRFFFGCSGRYLFASKPTLRSEECSIQTRRFDLLELNQSVDFCWADQRRGSVDVSPTGRYLVLDLPDDVLPVQNEEDMLYLYDTESNATIQLQLPEPLNYWNGKYQFSRDETRLTIFLFCRFNRLAIMIWVCLTTIPKLTSYAKWDVGSPTQPKQIHVHEAATSAVLVTETRLIQRIELGNNIEILDASKLIDEYPRRLSAISRDGSRWALVSYGLKGGKVQIIDLTSPDVPARHFDLEWSHSDIPEALALDTHPPIGISPDLHVLVINAEVFDLTTTNDKVSSEKLTLTPFTIEAAPALLKSHQHQYKAWGLRCQISTCNSYVIYVGSGDQWGITSRYSSAILLYRIDLKNRTSTQLDLMLPEGLISLSASFHPSLPLMAISYGSLTSTEMVPSHEEPPPLHLAICDIKTLGMTILELPEGQSTEAIARCWRSYGFLPRLQFSNCGTFAYLEGESSREDMWFQNVLQIDINPVPFRYIDYLLSVDSSLILFNDGNNTSVALELIIFDEVGFWRGNRPAVQFESIASYSSHHAAADRYLLGANDDERMRLLIAPHGDANPVIKTLSLSFAEARSRLQKEWERQQPTSQERDLGQAI